MSHNLNVNGNLYEFRNTAEEFPKDFGGDMKPVCEEITVMKTEIKEENDHEMPVDEMVFVNVKEEYISSPENNFEADNLKLPENTEPSLNKNIDIDSCEFREADLQENKYECELCHSNFDKEMYLKIHYELCPFAKKKLFKKDVHLSKKYKCNDCAFSSDKRADLTRHIRIHTSERLFKCTYKNCKCKPGQEEPCDCDPCLFAAIDKAHLNQHVLGRHSENPKRYKCKDCEYATHRKADLVLHFRTHSGDRPFKCTYKDCKCAPGQDQYCLCDTCGYSAKGKSTLRKHILLRHSAETKKHKCSDCMFASHEKRALMVHMRTHTNEKPYKCTYKNCKCTPGQEETCECEMCLYATADKANLRKHILVKHNAGPKKHKCQVCDYATHEKRCLVIHLRTHSHDRSLK